MGIYIYIYTYTCVSLSLSLYIYIYIYKCTFVCMEDYRKEQTDAVTVNQRQDSNAPEALPNNLKSINIATII